MPPKSQASTESLKQKSLMSFFAKAPAGAPKATPKLKTPSTKSEAKSSSSKGTLKPRTTAPSSPLQPKTPESKVIDVRTLTSSVGPSSPTSSRGVSTPPTSDVDMLASSDRETEAEVTRSKRKAIVVDSDSDEGEAPVRPLGRLRRASSPSEAARKKARISKALSEEEDGEEEEEEDVQLKAFSQRLNHFKKSPQKKGSNSKKRRGQDDDDFVVPDDESEQSEVEAAKSTKSSSRRSSFSATDVDDFLDDDEEDQPKRSKGKKPAAKASATKPATAASSGSGATFLTAAEQRALEKKDDKKKAESPFSFLQDIRDKDGKRPGEPGYDPRTLHIPSKAWKEFTPFEKQFWEIKQNHYDTILFFQKGKFFELYEDDARVGHQEFDLKLTSRVKMSMVGVPEMAFNFWAAKFLGKGYKVGRVEQAETALGAEMRLAAEKGKGKVSADKEKDKIVRRELNKVYTNGTLVDPALLTDENAGHCVCICEEAGNGKDESDNKFGICVLDCSTSQFNLTGFVDDICRTKLETLMRQICPKELLFKKGTLSVDTQRILKSILPSGCLWTGLRDVEGFKYDTALGELKTLFPCTGDDAMDEDEGILPSSVPETIRQMAHDRPAIEALGSMIWYLRQLNIDKDIVSMRNFNIYDPMKRGQNLTLDGQTLAHLELLVNNDGSGEGTLLSLLQRCVTPSGKRLFRIWLCAPLKEAAAINARLDAVEDIINFPTFEATFSSVTKGLPDLERIVSRIHAKSCKVKDFLKVMKAFRSLSKGLSKLADESENFDSKTILGLLRGAPDLLVNIKNLEAMFLSPEDNDSDELIPKEGKDEAYDEISEEIGGLEKSLENELKTMRKSTGLDLGYWHSAIGNKDIYLVEVAAKDVKRVPAAWTKSSGTKAKSRYIIPTLQKTIRKLKEARETRSTVIKTFKFRLFEEFSKDRSSWLRAVRVLSELDCLFSLAKSSTAIGTPSCRPEFVDGEKAFIDFQELRHPTVCLNPSITSFVDNDVKMGGDKAGIVLLTGPNMAGKSTLMRMTATGVIMAQLGMLVPASKARLCPVDSILTRMGAYDNMFSNASTFKVELDECCKILRDATPRSLVILDELGRGTSTFDGMAIAGAVLHELASHTIPLAFFATHYGSLTDDYAYHPNICRMYMSTEVDDERHELTFLYKLVEGVAESSFGTHVANLAGVPTDVVQRADVISKQFAKQFKERLKTQQANDAAARLPTVAQADFAYLVKLAMGTLDPPGEKARRREVLKGLRAAVRGYLPRVAANTA